MANASVETVLPPFPTCGWTMDWEPSLPSRSPGRRPRLPCSRPANYRVVSKRPPVLTPTWLLSAVAKTRPACGSPRARPVGSLVVQSKPLSSKPASTQLPLPLNSRLRDAGRVPASRTLQRRPPKSQKIRQVPQEKNGMLRLDVTSPLEWLIVACEWVFLCAAGYCTHAALPGQGPVLVSSQPH